MNIVIDNRNRVYSINNTSTKDIEWIKKLIKNYQYFKNIIIYNEEVQSFTLNKNSDKSIEPDFTKPENYPNDYIQSKENDIENFVSRLREKFATVSPIQAEAYKQVQTIAETILKGEGTEEDIDFIQKRDVDTETINPLTGEPVKSVEEACQVIVHTAKMWYDILKHTEIKRRESIKQLKEFKFGEVPDDIEKWLSENFNWIPEEYKGLI